LRAVIPSGVSLFFLRFHFVGGLFVRLPFFIREGVFSPRSCPKPFFFRGAFFLPGSPFMYLTDFVIGADFSKVFLEGPGNPPTLSASLLVGLSLPLVPRCFSPEQLIRISPDFFPFSSTQATSSTCLSPSRDALFLVQATPDFFCFFCLSNSRDFFFNVRFLL